MEGETGALSLSLCSRRCVRASSAWILRKRMSVPEGIPNTATPGWEMGAAVHVQDKKLVETERVWAKGKVVGVEGK